jgi:hypothetical protein
MNAWAAADPTPSPVRLADEEAETQPFATRVRHEHENGGRVSMRLVVVDAVDAEDARTESGLIEYDFHLATDAELDEWDRITAAALNDKDVEHLIYLLRRQQRELARRRRKVMGRGGRSYRSDVFRARISAELIGKLETLAVEEGPDTA